MPSSAQVARSFAALHHAKLIDLDRPIKALFEPEGFGGMGLINADDGPACLIHENYVLIHWPGKLARGIDEVVLRAPEIRGAGGYR